MNFQYQCIDPNGRSLAGNLQAEDRKQALNELSQQGMRVTRLKAVGEGGLRKKAKGKVKREDLLMALSELATLLRSGVSLKDSIDSLSGGDRGPELQAVLDRWSSGLRQGEAFSDALRASTKDLPEYLVQLVRAGEMTGEMGKSLQTAVDQMEYEKQIANEMKNALVYPAILCFSGIAAVMLVFIFVVPQFQNLLEQGDKLPLLAWLVLATGKWVNAHLFWVLGAAVALILILVRLFSLPAVRSRLMDGLQSVPVVGDWIIESETARWASILAALVGHKVPILNALELARSSARLPSRQARLVRVSSQVKSGMPMSTALKENAVITNTGYNLVRAGEKSGEVARLLKALAELHDVSGRNRMKRFLTLIEPMAILLIGGVIGVIITGVILAITSANEIAL